MPVQTKHGWISQGTKVRLRDGRTLVVTDAFDQTHMVTEHTPDGERPVAVHEFDDICIGVSDGFKAKDLQVFPASEVVSILE